MTQAGIPKATTAARLNIGQLQSSNFFTRNSMNSLVLYGLLATIPVYSIIIMVFGSKNRFPVKDRTAIVTGGSQGLGLAVAKLLAAKGANVVIVAQDVTKLEKAVESLRSYPQRFLHLSFDLRSPSSAPEIMSQVTKWNNGPPDIIFNCAGLCHPGFFADVSIEDLRAQMDTVYWTCAYMAHAALNTWTKAPSQSPRHLIFTSSVVAFLPMAGYTPYTAAKAAMRALADSLNQEVAVYNGAGNNIKIHSVFPMGILSPGFENENKIKPELTLLLEKDDKPQAPEEVAAITLNRLEAGDYMITTQLLGHLMRGWGMGGSVRSSLMDILWSWIGSLVIIFVAPDLISKCKKWGILHGMKTKPAGGV